MYVVPVSARAARSRANHVVFKGVEAARLLAAAEDDSCEALTRLRRKQKGKLLHLWAVRASTQLRPTWSRIAPGDWFVFYSRGRIFGVARVFDICDSRAVATALWGRKDGSEFRLLVLFDQVEQLDVPAWDYRSVLGSRFIGFRRLSDNLRATLIRKFGSVDAFVQRELPRAHARSREAETAQTK